MNQGKKQRSKKASTGSIRIIAGKHRGRKLPVITVEGLRPTTDRVKETVFNWLMPYIIDANCLDCFAGAGSLGFEALSRGAKKVAMIELNKAAAKQLHANKALLKADNLTIEQQDALAFLQQKSTEKYDLVFVDPPFRQNLIPQSTQLLADHWLAPNALIYLEMEVENTQQVPEHWLLLKEKIAGQVAYRLYQQP